MSRPPARFAALVVLGDSLSDCGNAGRFCDGPVWVERLARALGLPPPAPSREGGTNHAVGGARVLGGGPSDLRGQAGAYLAARGGEALPGALHVVWGGGNDLLASAWAPDRDGAARSAARAVAAIADDLAAAGAAHVLAPNLPDVGLAPAIRALGPAWAAEARRLTLIHNDGLGRALAAVEAARGIVVRRLDVFALGERVMAGPGAFGFRDVATPCRNRGRGCADALFWDEIHPTAAAHARLAEAALRALRTRRRGRAGAERDPDEDLAGTL